MKELAPINNVLFVNSADTFKEHKISANGSLYPNLGLITLMSTLKQKLNNSVIKDDINLGYYDGTVHGNEKLYKIIKDNAEKIKIICLSTLTSNYIESIKLAKNIKELNPNTKVIIGNDHFSATYVDSMKNQEVIDYGFYGNDVVNSFGDLVKDILEGKQINNSEYAGMVYRNGVEILKNPEDKNDLNKRALVEYDLIDSLIPTKELYYSKQKSTYNWMRTNNFKGTVIEIARGCIKFSGIKDVYGNKSNTCSFCGIIQGEGPIKSHTIEKAWEIIKNAYDQGYNYLYFVSDDLPMTFWPLLKGMISNMPDWYKKLSIENRPKAMGYSMSNAFDEEYISRIDEIMNKLGFNHFFVGLDGFSSISLKAMNKGFKKSFDKQLDLNLKACERISENGGLITAGGVLTHIGITKEIMKENYERIESIVKKYPKSFAALDFGVLCPLPGSKTFEYFKNPELAIKDAKDLGLKINENKLFEVSLKYKNKDEFDMDELINDFIECLCPDISRELVYYYENKINTLAKENGIVLGGGV